MLTWPCVTIEWKTPPIHTVDVSDASSGTSRSPVRRICPCGPQARALLGRQHDMRAVGAGRRRAARRPPPRPPGGRRRSAALSMPRSRSCRGEQRCVAEERGRRRRCRAAASCRGHRPRAAPARDRRSRGRRRRWRPDDRARAKRRSRARRAPRRERQRRVLQHRHRVLVLAAHARQALGVQRGRRPASRVAKPVELERVGRRNSRAYRSDPMQSHGWRPPTARFCRTASTTPREAMLQRRVIDVLADVVLVQPHRAVVGERDVLRVDEIDPACGACRRSRARHARTTPAQMRPARATRESAAPTTRRRSRCRCSSARTSPGLRGPSSGVQSTRAPWRRR